MSQELKKTYILALWTTGGRKSVTIDNSKNTREGTCWDPLFHREEDKRDKYILSFTLKGYDNHVNTSISEIPVLEKLFNKSKGLYELNVSANLTYTMKFDSKFLRMFFIRLLRASNTITGREFLETSMEYSSKRRKNLLYCFIINSCYIELKGMLSKGFIDSRSMFPSAIRRSYIAYNGIKNLSGDNLNMYRLDIFVYLPFISKKDIMEFMLNDDSIFHFDNKRSLFRYTNASNYKSLKFKSNKEFKQYVKDSCIEMKKAVDTDLSTFEKVFIKHNKRLVDIFYKK